MRTPRRYFLSLYLFALLVAPPVVSSQRRLVQKKSRFWQRRNPAHQQEAHEKVAWTDGGGTKKTKTYNYREKNWGNAIVKAPPNGFANNVVGKAPFNVSSGGNGKGPKGKSSKANKGPTQNTGGNAKEPAAETPAAEIPVAKAPSIGSGRAKGPKGKGPQMNPGGNAKAPAANAPSTGRGSAKGSKEKGKGKGPKMNLGGTPKAPAAKAPPPGSGRTKGLKGKAPKMNLGGNAKTPAAKAPIANAPSTGRGRAKGKGKKGKSKTGFNNGPSGVSSDGGANTGPRIGNKLLLNVMLNGTATGVEKISPVPGENNTLMCFEGLQLIDISTDAVIGSGADCLDVKAMSDVCGEVKVLGLTIYQFSSGEVLMTRGETTVQPVIKKDDGSNWGSVGYTHITGSISRDGEDNVIFGNGTYTSAAGPVRLSGAVNMNMETNTIRFDCIFMLRLELP